MQQHSTTVMNVRAIENEVGDEIVYTAINPRTDFFYDSAYFSEIAAGVVIYYNDGSTYEINIDIKAVAGSEPG